MKKNKCKCGGEIEPNKCFINNFLINCMKCDKCSQTLFTSEQTKEIIKLRDANNYIEGKRKIIKVGSSIAALLPKKIEKYGIKEGIVDNIRLLSTNSLEIRFNKDIVK